ncbi:unnamed protein product [Brachionus calyciflorus]|uniref:Uncharacterized protein n=1 Tax=Brachionus calyciflorus TaxID=104777 RepID=A0A813N6S5_9BILA|nr:unnamed protein product [Brachionus calyciflorus]
MDSNSLSLEDFCSNQKFMEDYELISNNSDNASSSPSQDFVSDLSSDGQQSIIIEATVDFSNNNFIFFENGFYKTTDIFYSLKRFDMITLQLIFKTMFNLPKGDDSMTYFFHTF